MATWQKYLKLINFNFDSTLDIYLNHMSFYQRINGPLSVFDGGEAEQSDHWGKNQRNLALVLALLTDLFSDITLDLVGSHYFFINTRHNWTLDGLQGNAHLYLCVNVIQSNLYFGRERIDVGRTECWLS